MHVLSLQKRSHVMCVMLPLAIATLSLVSCHTKEPTPESILSGMTDRQKIAQLMIVDTYGWTGDSLYMARMHGLVKEGIGGIIWMDAPVADLVTETNDLASYAKIPLLTTVDAEWGLSMRCPEYVRFPKQGAFGRADGINDLVYDVGRAVGEDLKDLRIHVDFAPVVDINSNPDVQVLGERSFGSDREKVAEYAAAYMRGMQDCGILACAKHFPGHGEAAVDSHRDLPLLDLSRRRLDSLELYPFRRLVNDGVAMVMVGHLSVPALDSTLTPSSISRAMITELLRGEMGFEGCIITDALGMKGLTKGRDSVKVVLDAFKAGADILLMPENPSASIDLMEQALSMGEINRQELDFHVLNVLALKKRAGIFSKGYDPVVRDLDKVIARAYARDTLLAHRIRANVPHAYDSADNSKKQ